MQTSIDYLEAALMRLRDLNEGEKAERLGVARNTLLQYKAGIRVMSDKTCLMVAEVLEIDPMLVIAAANVERSKGEDAEIWHKAIFDRKP